MTELKKIINNPFKVTDEMVEGFVASFSKYVRKLEDFNVVIRKDAPVQGKVGIIAGGGSGHEPFWLGYTGTGLCDAVVVGEIFSSPTPEAVYLATKAVDSGKGVLYILGNYSGDKMNFSIAAERAKAEGIMVDVTQVTDDVASAPKERKHDRRGVAGNIFVIKVAGAKAEMGGSLSEVKSVCEKANENIRSIGVALAPCIVPAYGKPHFTLKEDEIELGIGIHGEPGLERTKIKSADELTETLVGEILTDLPLKRNDEVAVMINGLGATPLLELLIVFRKVDEIMSNLGVKIHKSFIGNYCTSLEMAGTSITLMKLDNELKTLLDAPADAPFFKV